MKASVYFRWIWWCVLLLALGALVFARRETIVSPSPPIFDMLVFVLAISVALFPLYSEVEVFGFKVKNEIKETKEAIVKELHSLKATLTNVNQSSNLNQHNLAISIHEQKAQLGAVALTESYEVAKDRFKVGQDPQVDYFTLKRAFVVATATALDDVPQLQCATFLHEMPEEPQHWDLEKVRSKMLEHNVSPRQLLLMTSLGLIKQTKNEVQVSKTSIGRSYSDAARILKLVGNIGQNFINKVVETSSTWIPIVAGALGALSRHDAPNERTSSRN